MYSISVHGDPPPELLILSVLFMCLSLLFLVSCFLLLAPCFCRELYLARLHQMDLLDPVIQKAVANMNFVTINRVCGEMSIARSIGDSDYKVIPLGEPLPDWQFVWPPGHSQVIEQPLIIPEPEVLSLEITTEDTLLILGSDGLWDVIPTDLACKRVNDLLLANQLSLDEIAEDLAQLAIRLGSEDNVTVVIVLFEHDNVLSGYH